MVNLKTLGSEINKKRLALNFSLEKVASLASISKPTLIEIEKGSPKCEIGNYFKVMSIVGVDINLNKTSKKQKRQRATRQNLKIDKQINRFIVFCVQMYANHRNKSSSETYKLLNKHGLISLIKKDYEDMHGFGFEYINSFCDRYLESRNAL